MQIKTKKQIDIELDKSDLLEAVRDLLAKHGQNITPEELEEVRFINSPQTGIRASLKITEESGVEADSLITPETKVTTIEGSVITTNSKTVVMHEPEPEPEPTPVAVEPETEDPGAVEPSTVEDVMPGVTEMKELVEGDAEQQPVAAPEGRTKLFL